MSVYFLPLLFSPKANWACMRELCGHDILAIGDSGTSDAIGLLNRLLVESPEAKVGPGMAMTIATADRDQLLASVYKRTYGTRIESTIACQACQDPFDLNFLLDDLIAHIKGKVFDLEIEQEESGHFLLPKGCRFRLPTGEDELMIRGLPAQKAERLLLERCLQEGDIQEDSELIQKAMRQLAPVFETSLQADCPECEHAQQIHFDLQSFLLESLKQEQERLPYEIHRLAMAYGWSHEEILGLPRSLRKKYLSLIMAEYDLS